MKKTLAALGAAFLLLAVLLFAPIVKVKGATPTNLFSVLITRSEIESTTIGASSPSTGAFTSLSSTGGSLNGTIGTTTPNLGSFTSVIASTLTPGNCVQAATGGLLTTTTSACLAAPTLYRHFRLPGAAERIDSRMGRDNQLRHRPHYCVVPASVSARLSDASTTHRQR